MIDDENIDVLLLQKFRLRALSESMKLVQSNDLNNISSALFNFIFIVSSLSILLFFLSTKLRYLIAATRRARAL